MATITNARTATIKDLFNESAEVIRVPSGVQRQYSWEEEAETFYQDVVRFSKEAKDSDHYFMGSILTVWSPGRPDRDLIDGQQRLTTATILLAAIRDALWLLPSQNARTSASEVQRDFIAYSLDDTDDKKYFLQLTQFDMEFFRSHIQEWDPETGQSPGVKDIKAPSNRAILDAKKRFADNIAKAINGLETDEAKRVWLLQLRRVLVRQLQFVEVTTSSEDDANDVFETINDRGLKLSPLDLLRNFLLTDASAEEKKRINASWSSILEKARDATELEQLLRHYWVSIHGDVKARGLYKEVKRNLTKAFDAKSTNAKRFTGELESAANVYFDLRRSEVSDPSLRSALTEISSLGAQPLYPVLLSAFNPSDEGALAPLAEALISYYIRWSVIGRRESTLLETTMFDLAQKFRNGLSIVTAIKELQHSAGTDESFEAAFKTASVARQGWRRHVLVRLEVAIRESLRKNELVVNTSKTVHVEHIYPQNPDDLYRLKKDHAEWVNRLGNLTLLHQRLNTSIKNSPFPIKWEKAYKSTEILLTKCTNIEGLWDAPNEAWRPAGIAERQIELSKFAAVAWPL